jgi:hypothetical protein
LHMLLSFGEAIAKSKKSAEKLFVSLDITSWCLSRGFVVHLHGQQHLLLPVFVSLWLEAYVPICRNA